MPEEKRLYQAYLLRLWQVRTATGLVWHASLEDAQTGERRGFANLQSLLMFLEEQTNKIDQFATDEKSPHL
jgi:hypothetical protein